MKGMEEFLERGAGERVTPTGYAPVRGDLACPRCTRPGLSVRLGLRSAHRPVFHGQWRCSRRCLRDAVEAALRRESAVGSAGVRRSAGPHRHRVPLGLLLLSSGVITQEELQRALDVQRAEGGLLGQHLERLCGVPELEIARAVGSQWGCPAWSVAGGIAGSGIARQAALAPRAVLEACGMLPLGQMHGRLQLGFDQRVDASGAHAMERMHRVEAECGMLPDSQFQALGKELEAAPAVEVKHLLYRDGSDLEDLLVREVEAAEPVECRLVRVHGLVWMRLWLEPSALGLAASTEDVRDVLMTRRTLAS